MFHHLSHPELPPTWEMGEESRPAAPLTAGRGGGGGKPTLGPAPRRHLCSGAVLRGLRAGYVGSHSCERDAQCGAASLFWEGLEQQLHQEGQVFPP